jgi:hypothetical protein
MTSAIEAFEGAVDIARMNIDMFVSHSVSDAHRAHRRRRRRKGRPAHLSMRVQRCTRTLAVASALRSA